MHISHELLGRASIGVNNLDEIGQFKNGLYIGPPLALWNLYGYESHFIHPSVIHLDVHA